MMHWNETLVVALVATSAVLLLATAIAWRRMLRENPGLPNLALPAARRDHTG